MLLLKKPQNFEPHYAYKRMVKKEGVIWKASKSSLVFVKQADQTEIEKTEAW